MLLVISNNLYIVFGTVDVSATDENVTVILPISAKSFIHPIASSQAINYFASAAYNGVNSIIVGRKCYDGVTMRAIRIHYFVIGV